MSELSKALTNFVSILRTGGHGIPPHNAPELLDLWEIGMETQINVISALGTPTETKGVFAAHDNSELKFWNIRIPKGANTEDPTFKDYHMSWPLAIYAAGLGCTGWNWQEKVSRWVGYDFDAITGHATGVGVSDDELQRVKDAACALPYVEVRKSTGGNGLHLYVRLDDIPTETHTVHAALARCILGMMSSETGFDFASRIDACGGNMWIWHRKMTNENDGLALIKAAEKTLGLIDLPMNWRDHIDVVKRKRAKVRIGGIDNESSFDKLAASQHNVQLDDQHRAILDALRELPYACEWVADHNCVRLHTKALEQVHEELKLQGIFRTQSEGTDPNTPNAFMFPLSDGGFSVYRFSPGVTEAPTWEQDSEGWTTCQFNVPLDLRMASRACGAERDGSGFAFTSLASAIDALKLLGVKIDVNEKFHDRPAQLKVDKHDHVLVEFEKVKGDDHESNKSDLAGWIKGRSRWHRTTDLRNPRRITRHTDSPIRLVKTSERKDAGWLIPTIEGGWDWNNRENARTSLLDLDFKKEQLDFVMARAIRHPWTLVNLPFQPLYPGGRQINWGAPQYRFQPADTDESIHPHWDMILDHTFQELRGILPNNEWATANNIATPRDFGLAWIACLFRDPFSPLTYLFLHGDQECGKSTLPEAVTRLMTEGVVTADRAFTSKNDFNGELANAVLACIEETDLSTASQAYERLKSWVTAPMISIRKMRMDSYMQPNTLHFIQTANKRSFCPVFDGDTRITMLYVPKPERDIPKQSLMEKLDEEAPHFMRTILDLQLPTAMGRLRVPAIETRSKQAEQRNTRTAVLLFIDECCITGEDCSIDAERFREALNGFCESHGLKMPFQWSRELESIEDIEGNLRFTRGGRGRRVIYGLALRPASKASSKSKSRGHSAGKGVSA